MTTTTATATTIPPASTSTSEARARDARAPEWRIPRARAASAAARARALALDDGRLFSAGVIGGVAASVLASFARTAGVDVNLELWWGTLLVAPGQAAFLVGFFMHLTVAGFIGLIYGRALGPTLLAPNARARDGAVRGARIGLVHALFSGTVLGALALHPRIPELVAAPGPFMSGQGVAGVLALFALHAAYGAAVGALAHPQPDDAVAPVVRPAFRPRTRPLAG